MIPNTFMWISMGFGILAMVELSLLLWGVIRFLMRGEPEASFFMVTFALTLLFSTLCTSFGFIGIMLEAWSK